MKVGASVKKMCRDCIVVRRGTKTQTKRTVRVICKKDARHNQRQG